MLKPKVLVLTGFGINCDYETLEAFQMVGAEAERVHLNDLISGEKNMLSYQILAFPGGFSFGDDIASGKVLANKFKFNLQESLEQFIKDKKLIIGICNGFQVMVKLGILPGFDENYKQQLTTLTFNNSGKFENRWVYLKANKSSSCIFTQGIDLIYLPVRHGEGNFITKDENVLKKLHTQNQIVFSYVDENGKSVNGKYPENPNGAMDDIAGICDPTGKIFGLMPHPEAYLCQTNHPRWTREKNLPQEGMGVQVFRNAVEYIKKNF
ncbi:MAG: phosphoribosylformylglycinamidine synthase I [bacterium]